MTAATEREHLQCGKSRSIDAKETLAQFTSEYHDSKPTELMEHCNRMCSLQHHISHATNKFEHSSGRTKKQHNKTCMIIPQQSQGRHGPSTNQHQCNNMDGAGANQKAEKAIQKNTQFKMASQWTSLWQLQQRQREGLQPHRT